MKCVWTFSKRIQYQNWRKVNKVYTAWSNHIQNNWEDKCKLAYWRGTRHHRRRREPLAPCRWTLRPVYTKASAFPSQPVWLPACLRALCHGEVTVRITGARSDLLFPGFLQSLHSGSCHIFGTQFLAFFAGNPLCYTGRSLVGNT